MTAADHGIATVEDLLIAQRNALLTGDLDCLMQLPERLARAMRALASQRPPASKLARLAEIAGHNALLIKAAQRGIAETRARLDDRARVTLTTYDAAGRQWPTGDAASVLSRR